MCGLYGVDLTNLAAVVLALSSVQPFRRHDRYSPFSAVLLELDCAPFPYKSKYQPFFMRTFHCGGHDITRLPLLIRKAW